MKKIFRRIIIILIAILPLFFYWKYFYTYSEGYRAGMLQKFSHKGSIFKTYEGELILSSIKSTANVALASEKFLFSVTDDSLALQLDTIQGYNVMLHYKQKNSSAFWRGDAEYIVDGVKLRD
jgi:hypothetical protein